jgi:hypothetical protein
MAVLQGWSKSTTNNHIVSVGLLLAFGYAAFWGTRVLTGHH